MLKYSKSCEGAADLQEALSSILGILKAVNDSMHLIAITGYEVRTGGRLPPHPHPAGRGPRAWGGIQGGQVRPAHRPCWLCPHITQNPVKTQFWEFPSWLSGNKPD